MSASALSWAGQKAKAGVPRPSFPSTESFSLLGLQRLTVCLPLLHSLGWTRSRVGGGFLHRAVLSVSLSMSSRMRPGRSLLAESECSSGMMLRSGSEALELASLNIPISVLTEYGRSYIRYYFGSCGHCVGEVAIPSQVGARRMRGWGHTGSVPWLWYWSRSW